MRKLLIFSLFLSIAIAGFAQIIDRPVATVNLMKREVITQKQLKQQISVLESQLRTEVTKEKRKEVLDAMINTILVNQASERDGIKVSDFEVNTFINQQYRVPLEQSIGRPVSDADLRKYIQEQGIAWDEFYKQIKEGLINQRYITEKKKNFFATLKEPTEKDIRDVYEANSLQFTNPEIVKFSQIFIDTRKMSSAEKNQARKEAEGIYRDIQNGKVSFNDMLVKFSTSSKPNYQVDIKAYLARNDVQKISLLGAGFYENMFSLKEGDIKGVIESKVGFHIVKITDKLPKKFLTLDDPILPDQQITVRQYIKQQKMVDVQQKALQQATADIIKDLRKEAEIKVFEESLNW